MEANINRTSSFSKRELGFWLALSLVLHLLAAWLSSGYQNSDEHFQILEFLQFRLGLRPEEGLPIEYGRMLRSWVQPALYLGPIQLLRVFGDHNPFHWATSARFLSALIGWLSVVSAVSLIPRWITERGFQRLAVILCCLLWFLPVLHARHSGENLSGAFFLIGLGAFFSRFKHPQKHPAIAGLYLGLAFTCRFQVGLMVGGFFLWLLFFAEGADRLKRTLWAIFGFFSVLALSILIDRWGYGKWTLSPWNYVQFNLIEGQVNAHDISPWWDYFRRSWTESVPVLGFLQFLALLVVFVRYPKHILTWTHLPLLAAHTLIPHKETRFLFPLMHTGALFLCLSLYSETGRFAQWSILWKQFSFRALAWVFFVFNGVTLLVLTLTPVWYPIHFYQGVYEIASRYARLPQPPRAITVTTIQNNPYEILGIPMYFYRPRNIVLKPFDPLTKEPVLLAVSQKDQLPSGFNCTPLVSSYPSWVNPLMNRVFSRTINDWTLYRCADSVTSHVE